MQSIHETVWQAPGVQIYGQVELACHVSLWPNAVIRADTQHVSIGRYTNIQDFVMVHVGYDYPTIVGEMCSITHHATIHGCRIEDHCLIGINAVIMEGVIIGRGSIVAGGAVVREDSVFGPGSIIAGVPARQIAERDSSRENRLNAWQYHRNAEAFRRGEHRLWTTPQHADWLKEIRVAIATDADLARLEA
jgi:carbonic anhydrase/acetyltransferase-like protein (isoleucine patch superfamily)